MGLASDHGNDGLLRASIALPVSDFCLKNAWVFDGFSKFFKPNKCC